MRNRTEFCLLAVLLFVVGIVSGCSSKPAQDTKTSALPQVGIMDTQTVIKNHPKYAELQRLEQEYAVLAAEVQAAGGAAREPLPSPMNGATGLNEAAAQEFKAKMAAKEKELNTELAAAQDKARQSSQEELEAYAKELDKNYQPQIFSIQLKLKTVQLSKEDAAAAQAELERLQSERAAQIAAKQQELVKQMEQAMDAKKAELNSQLEVYGRQLNVSVASDLAAKQAEMAGQAPAGQAPGSSPQSEKQQQLAMKQQEVTVLQDFIISDIRDKAGKVAAEKGLEAVFANVRANISAVDITSAVIAEIKK